MRVQIVCYEDTGSWILGKISTKLCENLTEIGIKADVSKAPDTLADINHHIIYWGYDGARSSTDTVMITHIDEPWKVKKVCRQLINAEMGICMSRATLVGLANAGGPRERLSFINPAHDGIVEPRKIAIGITSRLYANGCKREFLIDRLAEVISPELFSFKIMGAGWDAIVEKMRRGGIGVEYWNSFVPDEYQKLIPSLDYYLYTGQDEGSMGFVDALAAGVATIVTPQGFHLDAKGGITHSFNTFEELLAVFDLIAKERRARLDAVATWTWKCYARRHAAIWQYVLAKKSGKALPPNVEEDLRQCGVARFSPDLDLEFGKHKLRLRTSRLSETRRLLKSKARGALRRLKSALTR